MASLREALEREKDNGPSIRRCTIGAYISSLNPDDRNAFVLALNDKALSAVAICRAVANTGGKLSAEVLARHRRHFCKCGEDAWRVIK
jgi:hypothetical protein